MNAVLTARGHAAIALNTFRFWAAGETFPRYRFVQMALADAVGGEAGRQINAISDPHFRHHRPPPKESDMTSHHGHESGKKAHRIFPDIRVVGEDGRTITKAEITCIGCSQQDYYRRNGSVESDDYFRKHGWAVGKDKDRDYCPKCVAKANGLNGKARASEHNTTITAADIRKATEAAATAAVETVIAMQATRELDATEKNYLLVEIERHFDGGAKGYQPGWSDQKIAEDSKLPVEGVREVREFFWKGSSGEDPDAAAREAEVAAVLKQAKDLQKQVVEAVEQSRTEIGVTRQQIKAQLQAAHKATMEAEKLETRFEAKATAVLTSLQNLLDTMQDIVDSCR
jgi:hypothetical protein